VLTITGIDAHLAWNPCSPSRNRCSPSAGTAAHDGPEYALSQPRWIGDSAAVEREDAADEGAITSTAPLRS